MRIVLRRKLVAAFAGVAVVTSVAGFLAMQGLESVSARYEHAMGTLYTAEQAAQGLDRGLEQKLLGVRGYALYMRSDMLQEIDAADKQIRTQADAFSALPVDDADKAVIQEVLKTNKEMDDLIKRAVSMVNGGKGKEAVDLLSVQAPAISVRMTSLTAPLVAKLNRQLAEDQGAAIAAGRQVTLFGYITIGSGLALALLLGYYMSGRIAGPVRQMAALAGRMAQGDLTDTRLKVSSSDEIGDMAEAFTIMAARLRNLMQGISERAGAVLTAAGELTENAGLSAQSTEQVAAALGQVAAGATEQATAATEVERALDELRQTIGQIAAGAQETAGQITSSSELLDGIARAIEGVAESANQVADGADLSAATAREGAAVVEHSIAGMDRIKAVVGEASAKISDLTQFSSQIGEITLAISEIADQTNLLALNAAIEAARAGEHGRGFAVVAEEVRRLAERSASFAREIDGLIGNIQGRTAEAARAMQAGNAEVEQGARMAAEASEALGRIRTSVEAAARDVATIATATHELQSGIGQVVRSFDAVASVTEENTAATEQMAAGAGQAAANVQRVAAISSENAAAAQEISATTEELTASAGAVASAAQQLHQIAQELQKQVGQFKV